MQPAKQSNEVQSLSQ